MAFELLRSGFNLPPSFLTSLANIHHPSPRSFPSRSNLSGSSIDFWIFIPVRVQVQCNEAVKGHASSSKGRSQMNPRNYLHLPHSKVDIRGSKITVYFSFKNALRKSSALVFNFFDGRWKKIIEEPIIRLREAYGCCPQSSYGSDPIYLQAAILTSTLRWWNNSLNSFNDQLIAYAWLPSLYECDVAVADDFSCRKRP